MVDILKMEVLLVVSTVQGRETWVRVAYLSSMEDGGIGPGIDRLAALLGVMGQSKIKRKTKYQKKKWMVLLPIALAELKKEGYKDLLGM